MTKVARVDAPFWVMKICATTLGETAGDLLSMTWSVGYARSSLLLLGVHDDAYRRALSTPDQVFWARERE